MPDQCVFKRYDSTHHYAIIIKVTSESHHLLRYTHRPVYDLADCNDSLMTDKLF